jgi:hypothetical protein
MNNIKKKKCLLIIPKSFYSFHNFLTEALNELGYEVAIANEEYPENTIGKLMGKLGIPLLLTTTRRVVKRDFLVGKAYDLALIIKGRGISNELISDIKDVCPMIVGYNFDSFDYHKAPLKWYKSVDRYCTFDYKDADKYSLPIVELFSSLSKELREKEISFAISAIVRNHSNRLKFIDDIFKVIDVENRFIYIYEQNLFTFCINFINSPILYLKYSKYISFKSLNYQEYIRVLHVSNFTIDYAHPKQSGMTMRCLEALSTQTKVISNNPFLMRNSNFSEKNAIIFDGTKENDDVKKQFDQMCNLTPGKSHRKISDFINDLLNKN